MTISKRCLTALLFGALMIAGCSGYDKVREDLGFLRTEKIQCTVMRVDSGDKFLCRLPGLGIETVRLAGVVIPEDKTAEAKSYTGSFLRRGTLLMVEPERNLTKSGGDMPGYVFVPGGKMLNILLVDKGLAYINMEEIARHRDLFMGIKEAPETGEPGIRD